MTDQSPRKAWGIGRIAILARLETITAELRQGLSLTMIYDRHQAALGVSYRAFCKLVQRYAGEVRPAVRRQRPDEAPSPPSPPPILVAAAPPLPTPIVPTPSTGGPSHARPDPAGRPTFHHHGIVQEGEVERLFGPGYFPKRAV